ncbi:MAG: hypothetical protein U5K30_08770 [Acidimicrobiales bacterium]|nr:hypothetical protein [Acidimicrobiales bacterium]
MSTALLRSPWPLRAVWLALPILLGPTLADALGDHSRCVQVVASAMAWGTWVVGVGALALLRSVTLTAVRLIVPGALPLAVWSAVGADRVGWAVTGLVAAVVALVLLAGPGVSDAFVNGSSYGSERRVALRVPLSLLVVPVPLAWALTAAGLVTGPLLLAVEQWVAGVIATVVGICVIGVAARQFHLLSRRWLVFVPAGLVVHDPLHLHDPILFPRSLLTGVGPALDGAADADDVIDATGGALGLVLEVRSKEGLTVGVRRGRDKEERDGIHALLVTPTQPASTLEIARSARLPVG